MKASGVVRLAVKLTLCGGCALLLTAAAPRRIDNFKSCYEQFLKDGYCQFGDGGLDDFERELAAEKKANPALDTAPFEATLKAARAKAAGRMKGQTYATAARTLTQAVDKLNPNDCVTVPGGCDQLKKQLAAVDAAGMEKWAQEAQSNPQQARDAKAVLKSLEEARPALKAAADRFFTAADEHFTRVKGYRADSLLLTEKGCKDVQVIVDGGLQLSPGHEKLSRLDKAVRALLADVEKQRDATVYGNPFHRTNAGKVRVSGAYQEPGQEDPAAFVTSATAGKPLFGNAYFNAPIGELTLALGKTANVTVRLSENDKEFAAATWGVEPKDDEFKKAYTSFEIFPLDPKDPSSLYLSEGLVKGLAALEPGKHTVTVTVDVQSEDASSGSTGASGSFEYDNTAGNAAVEAAAKVLSAKVLDLARMPEAAMKDKALDAQVTAAVNRNEFGDKALRVVLTDSDFTYVRNEWTGVLLSRQFHAAVAVKRKDGTCEVRNYPFEQQAAGGNKFAAATTAFHAGEYAIRCENISKK